MYSANLTRWTKLIENAVKLLAVRRMHSSIDPKGRSKPHGDRCLGNFGATDLFSSSRFVAAVKI